MTHEHRRPKAPYCWQEKNNTRYIRSLVKEGVIKRSEGRNILDVFRAITEMLSDNASGTDLTGTNLAKRLGAYALMGTSTTKRALSLMEQHGIVSITKQRDPRSGQYESTQIELNAPPERDLQLSDDSSASCPNPSRGPISSCGVSHGGHSNAPIEEYSKSIEERHHEEERGAQNQRILKIESEKIPQRLQLSREELQQAVDEVIEHLCERTGRDFDAHNGGTQHLRARLNAGAEVDDCKLLIDHRVALWLKDARMTGYLRPETLFSRRHFDHYLQLACEWARAGRPEIQPSGPTLQADGHNQSENVAPTGARREELIDKWRKMSQ